MTQKDKELLLKDLCSRLPYGLKGRVYAEVSNGEYDINGDMIFFDSPFDVILDNINTSTEEIHVIAIGNEDTVDFIEDQQTWGDPYTIDNFKPYLRSMSSMTEEEKKEYNSFIGGIEPYDWDFSAYPIEYKYVYEWDIKNYIDFLNAHHFDYRGLIPKGFAIEVTEDNNPYKK